MSSFSTEQIKKGVDLYFKYNCEFDCKGGVGKIFVRRMEKTQRDVGRGRILNKMVVFGDLCELTFRRDLDLPEEWYGGLEKDYKFRLYGFDRGHMCPSADRTSSYESNESSFLMTNMVPQSPDNNRLVWADLEKLEREFVKEGNEVYIFAGPLGHGGTSDRGFFETIPVHTEAGQELSITVPVFTWKILLILPEGEDDRSRINELTTIIAVCVLEARRYS